MEPKHTGGMGIWHSVRASEKQLGNIIHDRRKWADAKNKLRAAQFLDVKSDFKAIGKKVKIHYNRDLYREAEDGKHLMPWQGKHEMLIDRYDCRTWLDIIPENKKEAEIPADEDEIESELNFERYGAIVEGLRNSMEEELHVSITDNALRDEENPPVQQHKKKEKSESTAGKGEYSAAKFTYNGSNVVEGTDEEMEEDPLIPPDSAEGELEITETDRDKIDALASQFFDIEEYSNLLLADRQAGRDDRDQRRSRLERIMEQGKGTRQERKEKKQERRHQKDLEFYEKKMAGKVDIIRGRASPTYGSDRSARGDSSDSNSDSNEHSKEPKSQAQISARRLKEKIRDSISSAFEKDRSRGSRFSREREERRYSIRSPSPASSTSSWSSDDSWEPIRREFLPEVLKVSEPARKRSRSRSPRRDRNARKSSGNIKTLKGDSLDNLIGKLAKKVKTDPKSVTPAKSRIKQLGKVVPVVYGSELSKRRK